MAYVKRLSLNENFNPEEYKRDGNKTLGDLVGRVVKEGVYVSAFMKSDKNNSPSLTDKGVYTSFDGRFLEDWSNGITELVHVNYIKHGFPDIEVYEIYVKNANEKYFYEIGYILVQDGNPLILTQGPGDSRGCFITRKREFIVSGHDGNYIFDIDNPENFDRFTW